MLVRLATRGAPGRAAVDDSAARCAGAEVAADGGDADGVAGTGESDADADADGCVTSSARRSAVGSSAHAISVSVSALTAVATVTDSRCSRVSRRPVVTTLPSNDKARHHDISGGSHRKRSGTALWRIRQ